MLKRTLYFGNPTYLNTRLEQLLINHPNGNITSIPIEDIAVVVLDHSQITITQTLLNKLLEYNVALITCDAQHHPKGMFYVLESHTLQSLKFKHQINATQPLKKQLWQQVVKAKIHNQAKVLESQGQDGKYLYKIMDKVKSGDSSNAEGTAAQYYWPRVFNDATFYRSRTGYMPNSILNYGYSIIRALTARSIVAAGLMPTLGIFHRNQYNAFCLADDMMEPYRPYVDLIVCKIVQEQGMNIYLDSDIKKTLLQIVTMDVNLQDKTSPLMIALQKTIYSLAKCYQGEQRKLHLPEL
jgi:CRISPR-associated protein Cas1